MHSPRAVLDSNNLPFVETLYQRYLEDASSVPPDWRDYFQSFNGRARAANAPVPDVTPACGGEDVDKTIDYNSARCNICGRQEQMSALQQRVDKLIRNFRVRGHRMASLDPLGMPTAELPELDPAYHGLDESVMDKYFSAGTLAPTHLLSLREIIEALRETYCRSIGVQFMHIDDLGVREWLQERMEGTRNRITLRHDEQLRILRRLTDAVALEEFIHKKFTGSKRFSLEGAESLIPLLDMAIEQAGDDGVNEIVMGMAHRGRVNVLLNIMGKAPRDMFRSFIDTEPDRQRGGGDVKYHLGHHSDWKTVSGQEVHLALCFNPSHLELVNPVAQGRVRAKQDRLRDLAHENSMLLLIHGDAAFAGEGVVQETLNLSQLEGYSVGGTLHVIVNNQIGFTTTPGEGRSSVYASDVAKMLQSPIFHVNGENPEAVAQAITLAMDFRRSFKRDVVIDMYCYRRWGHNEGDEPSFTQPLMYKAIAQRESVRDGYLENLRQMGDVTREEADGLVAEARERLEAELEAAQQPREDRRKARSGPSRRVSVLGRVWKQYTGGFDAAVPEPNTGISPEDAQALLHKLHELPDDFTPHPKIERLLKQRRAMASGERPMDWAACELLAYASLATSGHPVRMSGQDCRRGTFSHRHAVLYDHNDGAPYTPLQHLDDDQASVEFYNSPLSEVGVLGFEYGYSIAYPDALVLWEAQFGDFTNNAQALIDQGISSAEDKWGSLSGLVMLLPHGFEGMGPEHSSARLERFLMLAAEDNIQVAQPTTPAQMFHLLRRQVVRPWRKPLVVLTPKSLLRHPKVVSTFDDVDASGFQRIIPDTSVEPSSVSRVLLCTGKIYYDLLAERDENGREDVAILRVEQLYPLQENHIQAVLEPYRPETDVVWVQEEPENMGAWPYWRMRFCQSLLGTWSLRGIYRHASASPATGSASTHKAEQRELIEAAFA